MAAATSVVSYFDWPPGSVAGWPPGRRRGQDVLALAVDRAAGGPPLETLFAEPARSVCDAVRRWVARVRRCWTGSLPGSA